MAPSSAPSPYIVPKTSPQVVSLPFPLGEDTKWFPLPSHHHNLRDTASHRPKRGDIAPEHFWTPSLPGPPSLDTLKW